MKQKNSELRGLIIFIVLFISILLLSFVFVPLSFWATDYFETHHVPQMDYLTGIFLGCFSFFTYPVLQVILIAILGIVTMRATKNKYLLRLFSPDMTAFQILLVLIIFDIMINLIAGNFISRDGADNNSLDFMLTCYNLYIAPSPKFLIIFFISRFNRNPKTNDA